MTKEEDDVFGYMKEICENTLKKMDKLLKELTEALEALVYLAEQVDSDCPQEYRSKWLKDALEGAEELIDKHKTRR